MKFAIIHRWTKAVVFEATIECAADATEGLKLGLAVRAAIQGRANLDGANLYGANLDGANLYGANLTRANLDGANLTRANLTRANLTRANLDGANLDGANLYGANLDGANLYGANLTRANLDGAKGADMSKPPVALSGLHYRVVITDTIIQIGCEKHLTAEWRGFSATRIAQMDGCNARRFWKAHKAAVLALADAHQRVKEGV